MNALEAAFELFACIYGGCDRLSRGTDWDGRVCEYCFKVANEWPRGREMLDIINFKPIEVKA